MNTLFLENNINLGLKFIRSILKLSVLYTFFLLFLFHFFFLCSVGNSFHSHRRKFHTFSFYFYFFFLDCMFVLCVYVALFSFFLFVCVFFFLPHFYLNYFNLFSTYSFINDILHFICLSNTWLTSFSYLFFFLLQSFIILFPSFYMLRSI